MTVTGVDDNQTDGNQEFTIRLLGDNTTNDNRYRDLLPPTVTLTNIDDETAGFMVSTITGNTSENGSTATFTVYLTSQPTDNVTLTLFSDDSSEGEVTPELYRFTTSSWNTPKPLPSPA